jgi:glycosyltransferase involved in cell wall biosynthesis
MNILMLGRWVPPPRRPIRATREYQFARELARHHRLTLAFIVDTADATGSISVLRSEFGDLEFAAVPRTWKSLASALRLAAGDSCTLFYTRSEALRTRLAERLRRTRYDAVFVSSSSMIPYALEIDPKIPVVVDFAAVDSEWWVRRGARGGGGWARFFKTEGIRLRAAEREIARRAARCLVETAEADRIIRGLAPHANPVLVPSGIDVDAFRSGQLVGKTPTVVFMAEFGSDAEARRLAEFARALVPAVGERMAGVRFVIASRESVAKDRALEQLGIELAAPLADQRWLFHSKAVAVVPFPDLSDLRTTVLEPMAAGVPMVTSSSIRDELGAKAGQDLQAAADLNEFAARTVELLESTSLREEMGRRGQEFVRATFGWEIFSARLGGLLAGLAPSPAPGPGPAAESPAPIHTTR